GIRGVAAGWRDCGGVGGRRTTLMVGKPSWRPSRTTMRPRALAAAVWSNQAPRGTLRILRVIIQALAGLTKKEAACSSETEEGTGTTCRAGTTTFSCQLPPC